MKKYILIILVLTGASFATMWILDRPTEPTEIESLSGPMAEGNVNNPLSRKAFELERLKDPATGEIPKGIRSRELAFAKRLPKKSADRSGGGLSWIPRGPSNKGGRTRALAVDVSDEAVILAGGVTGGMWRSEDAGETFTKVTDPSHIHSVSSVVQDTRPGHEDIWYYGTGEEFYGVVSGTSFSSPFSGDGIFKSTDSGQTWSPLESTTSGTPQNTLQNGSYDFVWNMAIDHTDTENDVVLAAVVNGIIRSEDGGETWNQVLGFAESLSYFTDIMITEGGTFYAVISDEGDGSGFYRSENGIDWVDISLPSFASVRRTVMTYNPQNENEVYFLYEGPTFANNLGHCLRKYTYISGDGTGDGGIWEDLSANLPQESCVLFIGSDFDFGSFQSQNSYDLCISHHPTEEDVIYIGGRNIFRSTDGFTSPDNTDWIGGYRCNEADPKDYSYPNHHSDQHKMVFVESDPDVMYSANDGGVYRTDNAMADSVVWTSLNNGYITTQFYTVAMEQGVAESDFVMGGMQDNGTWITNSVMVEDDWKEVHADDGAFCAIPEGRDYVISSSQLGRIYKKELDDEGNLVNTKRIDPSFSPSMLFINPLMLDPHTHDDLYLVANKSIWKLDDVNEIEVDGNYYDPIPNSFWESVPESDIPLPAGRITCMDIPKIDNSVIYYGTNFGGIWKLENQFDEEPVQTELETDFITGNHWVSAISVNPLDKEELLVSVSNYNVRSIFYSSDGGESFSDVSGNLEENADGTGAGPAVYWVDIYPSDPKMYFAATSVGLFSTMQLDGDNTEWVQEGPEEIGNIVVDMITSRPWDGSIAIGTHGNGIYSSALEPVPTISINGPKQATISAQTFPNPFTQEITFEYSLKNSARVKLSIMDMNGRLVEQIVDKDESRGIKKVMWRPTGLAKGTYVYNLQIGNESKTGKIIYN